MKKTILSVFFVTILALFLGPLSAMGEDSQFIKGYGNAINQRIAKCHSKVQLKDSKSKNLQNRAALEIKKANFFGKNKEMLIKEMVEKEIGLKQYKIEYFLNQKFYEYSTVVSNRTVKGKKL